MASQTGRRWKQETAAQKKWQPRNKMGAGVATSPHLSQVRTAAPVRAWRLSWAGRACPVEASFDGGPVGFRPRSCDLGRFPFAAPSAEASGSAGPSKKVGSACASRFSLEDPLHCFGGLRPEGHRPPPRWPRSGTFFPCGKSAPRREGPYDSAFRFAPRGIWAPLPVDNGDIEDKSANPPLADKRALRNRDIGRSRGARCRAHSRPRRRRRRRSGHRCIAGRPPRRGRAG
ncbi:MAG: hypothetical protein QOH47_1909 [Sphingomonadales bacterium]|nr:hypothetical protein [Sphingomonadales bacterium]